MSDQPTTPSELRLLPTAMSFTSGNVAESWKRFKQRMEYYFAAIAVNTASNKKKIGILMTALGNEGIDILNTFDNIDSHSSYADVVAAFDKYCNPRKNTIYERFRFSQLVQKGRPVDVFLVELKTQAQRCDFAAEEFDNLVRDRLVVGIDDERVRKELLRDPDLTLETATSLVKIWEKTEFEASEIAKSSQSSRAAVELAPVSKVTKESRDRRERPDSPSGPICPNCGYVHRTNRCPAEGKECNFCRKIGHFGSMCRKRLSRPAVAALEEKADAGPDKDASPSSPTVGLQVLELYSVTSTPRRQSSWYATISVNKSLVTFKVDSGAQCNTITASHFHRLEPQPELRKTSVALRPYGESNLIVPLGEISAIIEHDGRAFLINFFVIEVSANATHPVDNILGLPTIEDIGLVKKTFSVETVYSSKQVMFNRFPEVFDGKLGDIPGFTRLLTKPDVLPVVEKPRRFAFAVKKKLCDALVQLRDLEIIAPVDEPTPWASNLIAVTKPNGALRVCLDPKHLNEALIVPKCEVPKSEDIYSEFDKIMYFTVLDLKDGFWQCKLDDESSLLTTFNSPIGRFRWKRLVMGISSAPEVFMNKMRQIFGGLKGVYPYFDDIIVTGTDEQNHDANLEAVLERAKQMKVKFNPDKIQFKQSSVDYLGFKVGQDGVRPMEKHVEAVTQMPRPTDKSGVLRFLGLTRYLARFIPDLSANTEALRALTHKNVPFEWSKDQETEFCNIKKQIASATSLKFYKEDEPLFVQTDSSKSGLGCCLYQSGAPIAYASRALTRTEQHYAQIEKELLAVVFALERFHDYTYGRPVTVFSDHRPLVAIVKKPIPDLTPRLQRLRLRLLRYNFSLLFQPGKELFVADTLSRAYLESEPADESYQLLDVHVTTNVAVTPKKLADLVAATATDADLQALKVYLRGGWPKSKSRLTPALRKFRTCADNLHEQQGLIFFRGRIVVPAALIPEMLTRLHEGHLNVQKTKQLARRSLFWLGMTNDIEMFVASCTTCNRFRRNHPPESLRLFPCPEYPWQRLHTDILTHDGADFLVVYDAYSQWVELFALRTKSINEVITHFKNVFARFGVPMQIVSDNIPYNSADWLAFAEAWNFEVLFSSPRFPQANGASEKAVSIVKRILQKNVNVQYALLMYRNAPIPHLGYSPAQLMFGRALRTRVPCAESSLRAETVDHTKVYERKLTKLASQKYYFDRGARDLPPLQKGDEVYYKLSLSDKEWRPGVVSKVATSPRAYEVTDPATRGTYLRNRRFIQKPARYRT